MPEWIKSKPIIVMLAVIAVALLGNAFFAARFFVGRGQLDDVAYELEKTKSTLAMFKDTATLLAELEQTEAGLNSQQLLIPGKLSGPQIVDFLSELAESSGLEMSEIYTQQGNEVTEGEYTYTSLIVGIQLSGELDALIAFLRELEGGAMKAIILDSLDTVFSEALSAASPSQGSSPGVQPVLQAGLNITVFGRKN